MNACLLVPANKKSSFCEESVTLQGVVEILEQKYSQNILGQHKTDCLGQICLSWMESCKKKKTYYSVSHTVTW